MLTIIFFSSGPRGDGDENSLVKNEGRDLRRGLWLNLLGSDRLHLSRFPRKRRSRYLAKPVGKLHRKRGKLSHETISQFVRIENCRY
jgi:hypothetical protein